MNSGFLFYWISWIFLIGILFFMKKNNKRTILAYWVLSIIICSNVYLTIDYLSISASFLLLFTGSAIWLILLPRLTYQFICSFTVSLMYASIHFWLNIAPVWLFMPITVLIPVSCCLFVVLLVKEARFRMAIGLFGICCGETIYGITMTSYGLYREIGEFIFFDHLAVTLLIFAILAILQKGAVRKPGSLPGKKPGYTFADQESKVL